MCYNTRMATSKEAITFSICMLDYLIEQETDGTIKYEMRRYRAILAEMVSSRKIDYQQKRLKAMRMLKECPGLSQREIARRCGISSPTVSRLFQKMFQGGRP